MENIILKNGLYGGIIVCIVMLSMVFYMQANPDNQPNAIIGFISMLLAFSFVYIGIKQQREVDGDAISFGKGFKTGMLISLIMSTMYVLIWLIVYYNFFPNFMEQYSEMVIKNAKPEELAAKTAEMETYKEYYKSPIMIILLTFMEIFPLGIIVSIILALILKRKKQSIA